MEKLFEKDQHKIETNNNTGKPNVNQCSILGSRRSDFFLTRSTEDENDGLAKRVFL